MMVRGFGKGEGGCILLSPKTSQRLLNVVYVGEGVVGDVAAVWVCVLLGRGRDGGRGRAVLKD